MGRRAVRHEAALDELGPVWEVLNVLYRWEGEKVVRGNHRGEMWARGSGEQEFSRTGEREGAATKMPRGMTRSPVFRELQRAWCGLSKVTANEVESWQRQDQRALCVLLKDARQLYFRWWAPGESFREDCGLVGVLVKIGWLKKV